MSYTPLVSTHDFFPTTFIFHSHFNCLELSLCPFSLFRRGRVFAFLTRSLLYIWITARKSAFISCWFLYLRYTSIHLFAFPNFAGVVLFFLKHTQKKANHETEREPEPNALLPRNVCLSIFFFVFSSPPQRASQQVNLEESSRFSCCSTRL